MTSKGLLSGIQAAISVKDVRVQSKNKISAIKINKNF
jgi:hypothetical protein